MRAESPSWEWQQMRAAHLSILFIQHDATSCTPLINEQKTFRIRTLSGVVCVFALPEPNKTTALKKWSAFLAANRTHTLIFFARNSLDEWRFFYIGVIKSVRPPRRIFIEFKCFNKNLYYAIDLNLCVSGKCFPPTLSTPALHT
jgi:hypothetical protein